MGNNFKHRYLSEYQEQWRDGDRALTALPFGEMSMQWLCQPPDPSIPETLKAAVAEKLLFHLSAVAVKKKFTQLVQVNRF